MNLIESQLSDALAYMKALREVMASLPDKPEWQQGQRLLLPAVIPLGSDFPGDDTVYAWLVANDFEGYDLTTNDPTKGNNG